MPVLTRISAPPRTPAFGNTGSRGATASRPANNVGRFGNQQSRQQGQRIREQVRNLREGNYEDRLREASKGAGRGKGDSIGSNFAQSTGSSQSVVERAREAERQLAEKMKGRPSTMEDYRKQRAAQKELEDGVTRRFSVPNQGAVPRPQSPIAPRATFPTNLTKFVPKKLPNVPLDLIGDLLFPEPLNVGEDEALRRIKQERELNRNPPQIIDSFPTIGRGIIAVVYADVFNMSLNSSSLGYNEREYFVLRYQVFEPFNGIRSAFRKVIQMYDGDPLIAFQQFWLRNVSGVETLLGSTEVGLRFVSIIGFIPEASPELDPGIDIPPVEGLRFPGIGIITPKPPGVSGIPRPGIQIKPPPNGTLELPQWRLKPPTGTRPEPPWKPWNDLDNPLEIVPPTTPETPERETPTIPSPGQFPQLDNPTFKVPLPPFQKFPEPLSTRRQDEEDCQPGEQCMTCRFNPALIQAMINASQNQVQGTIQTSELKLIGKVIEESRPIPDKVVEKLGAEVEVDIFNEEKQKTEKKKFKFLATSKFVTGIQALFAEVTKLRKEKAVATVPDRFKTLTADNKPQMVILYQTKDGKGYYQTSIPWAKNAKPPTVPYRKGNHVVILELVEGGKMVINASTESEGRRVINALKAMILPEKLKGATIVTTTRHDNIKEVDVVPNRADFYATGHEGGISPDSRYLYD